MTVTVQSFREHYPEFTDQAMYPDATVAYWLSLAGMLLNATRWANVIDVGYELFTAHNIVLEAIAAKEAANGAPPGGQVGPANNKSVDKVSIGFDVASGVELDAGHWNLTTYGTRFIKLARMFGAGPIQVGAGVPGAYDSGAWPGPIWGSYPNPSG